MTQQTQSTFEQEMMNLLKENVEFLKANNAILAHLDLHLCKIIGNTNRINIAPVASLPALLSILNPFNLFGFHTPLSVRFNGGNTFKLKEGLNCRDLAAVHARAYQL
jgi:hypothetical protein